MYLTIFFSLEATGKWTEEKDVSLALHSYIGMWTQTVWTQLRLPDSFFSLFEGDGVCQETC